MPLNRDQCPGNSTAKSATSFVASRQHIRSRGPDYDQVLRSSTPQNETEVFLKREVLHDSFADTGNGQQFADQGRAIDLSAVNNHKIQVPDTMQPYKVSKRQHLLQPGDGNPYARQDKNPSARTTGYRDKQEQYTQSVFDDTTSLNKSDLEFTMDENQTMIFHPANVYSRKPEEKHSEVYQGPIGDGEDVHESIDPLLGPNWQDEVNDEKNRMAQELGHIRDGETTQRPVASMASRLGNESVAAFGFRQELETPSRTQSAPPAKKKIHAPAPIKNVNFASSDEVVNFSPDFRSSELARENPTEEPISRPSSAQHRTRNVVIHPKPQRHAGHSRSQLGHSNVHLANIPDRFGYIRDHQQDVMQENQKVSAPESDTQDFSEDEHGQLQHLYGDHGKAFTRTATQPPPTRKRSYDDMKQGLDYSHADLMQKNLSDLQTEAFTLDPRMNPRPTPTDSVGNEMPLAQVLENLGKVSVDAQRETFQGLTDEQWAQTGQWFVDKFQADLKELMNTRLQRRKIALGYEDRIRRRQRLVEHHEADVDRELQELHTGGRQLVDGRKAPCGSRSGTPIKNAR